MRKQFLQLILILFSVSLFATISPSNTGNIPPQVKLISESNDATVFSIKINSYELHEVTTQNGNSFILNSPEASQLLAEGAPDLPKLTKSLIIPGDARMYVDIVSSEFVEINNIDIAPSKGNLSRDVDPALVPYSYGKIYNKNEFFPNTLAFLREPYILRDFRGQTVVIQPFQYNPVSKTLRIYTEITIRVFASGKDSRNVINETNKISNTEFKHIYKRHFLNFKESRYTVAEETGGIAVICHQDFIEAIQPYVDWKIQKGIPTSLVNSNNYANSAAIASYIQNEYTNNGISFVLLVGDASYIPTVNASSGESDNSYGFISGNDSYPELFVGRFSCETVPQCQTMVERTIDYELFADTSWSYLDNNMGIASSQGPGDDNEMDYEHIRNMQTDLNNFTYNSFSEFFDGSQGGLDASGNPSATAVGSVLNSGTGSIVYTGHGSSSSFVTSGFSNSDIDNLINTNKLPFIWSVACVNGDFVGNTCFAEKWLRAEYNGNPSGAVATLMSTINQSWDPPMCGQDEMVDILVESYTNNIKRTFGALSLNGCMQMIDEYGNGGESMLETWNLFGDPALMVRTATPQLMTISHLPTVFIGESQFSINCDADDAIAAITQGNTILGTGVVSGGMTTVNFPALSNVGQLTLTITAFNKVTYVTTIDIVPNNGPYVTLLSKAVNDLAAGNANNMADYKEIIDLDISLQNVGIEMAYNVVGSLSSSNSNITINNSSYSFGNIDSNTVTTNPAIFNLTIADGIQDQESAQFTLTLTDDSANTWESNFVLVLQAPQIALELVDIDDSAGNNNGRLDPGETINFTVNVHNTGHAVSDSAITEISSTYPFISFTNNIISSGNIAYGNNIQIDFEASILPTAQIGSLAEFELNSAAGMYSTSFSFDEKVGLIVEDWESNDFTSYSWSHSGAQDWFTINTPVYEGDYAVRSGNIGGNQSSIMALEIDVLADDSISFYKMVSCEDITWGYYYDYLEFFIDSVSIEKFAGEENSYTRVAYPISAGQHIMHWMYKKDNYYSGGDDCAYIDFIVLPPLNINYAPYFNSSPIEEAWVDSAYTYNIESEDTNTGDTLSINCNNCPTWMTFTDNGDGTASITGIPAMTDTGFYNIELAVFDNGGLSATQQFTLEVKADLSSVDFAEIQNSFMIYPNPAHNFISIDISNLNDNIHSLEIIDVNGKVLIQKTNLNNHHNLDISNLKAGNFIVKLNSGKAIHLSKLIVH